MRWLAELDSILELGARRRPPSREVVLVVARAMGARLLSEFDALDPRTLRGARAALRVFNDPGLKPVQREAMALLEAGLADADRTGLIERWKEEGRWETAG